jgi:hypothetical protein
MHTYYDENESINPVLIACYVDDGVIAGPRRLVEMILQWLGEYFNLKVTKGNEVRVLGAIFIHVPTKDNVLTIMIRMEKYIESVYEDLCKELGLKKNGKLRRADTPEHDENYDFLDEDFEKGALADSCRRFVGRLLYLVRACRFDAFHAVQVLATETNEWLKSSDRKLVRVTSYLYCTKDWGPNWMFRRNEQRTAKHLYIHGRSDADHGGCKRTGRSTTGYITWLEGPGVEAVVDWCSKRQSRAAASTAEAETIATKDSWCRSLLPLAGMMEQALCNEICLVHEIDADAARSAILKGISIALKYLRKYSRISLAWLHDASKIIRLGRIDTDKNESDILTKGVKKEVLMRHLIAMKWGTTSWDSSTRRR